MFLSFAISEKLCVLPASRSVRHWSIWPLTVAEIWVVLVVLVLYVLSVLVLCLYGHPLLQNWSSQKKLGLQAATAAMTGPKRCARNHLKGLGHIPDQMKFCSVSHHVIRPENLMTENQVLWDTVFLQAKVLQHSGIQSRCDVAQLQLFNAHAQFRPQGLLFGWQLILGWVSWHRLSW